MVVLLAVQNKFYRLEQTDPLPPPTTLPYCLHHLHFPTPTTHTLPWPAVLLPTILNTDPSTPTATAQTTASHSFSLSAPSRIPIRTSNYFMLYTFPSSVTPIYYTESDIKLQTFDSNQLISFIYVCSHHLCHLFHNNCRRAVRCSPKKQKN